MEKCIKQFYIFSNFLNSIKINLIVFVVFALQSLKLMQKVYVVYVKKAVSTLQKESQKIF